MSNRNTRFPVKSAMKNDDLDTPDLYAEFVRLRNKIALTDKDREPVAYAYSTDPIPTHGRNGTNGLTKLLKNAKRGIPEIRTVLWVVAARRPKLDEERIH